MDHHYCVIDEGTIGLVIDFINHAQAEVYQLALNNKLYSIYKWLTGKTCDEYVDKYVKTLKTFQHDEIFKLNEKDTKKIDL